MSPDTSSDVDPKPKWDPSDLLDLDPEALGYRCVGIAKSTNARCRKQIDQEDHRMASLILRKISLYAPTSSVVEKKLRDLAALLLCREYHRDQAVKIASKWNARIHEATADVEEPQAIRSEVDRLQKIIVKKDKAQTESQSQQAKLNAELVKLKDELSAVKEDKQKWKESSKEQEKQVDQLSAQVIGLRSQSAKFESDLRHCEHNRATLMAQKIKLMSQKDDLKKDLDSTRQKNSTLWWEAANKQLHSESREKADRAKITRLGQQVDNIRLRLVNGHLAAFCREAKLRVASNRLEDARSELEKGRKDHMENIAQLGCLQKQIDGLRAKLADVSSKSAQREAEMGAIDAADKAKIQKLSQQVEELEERLSSGPWKVLRGKAKQLVHREKSAEL